MKFVVLDDMKSQMVSDKDDRRKNIHNTYTDQYHYLDQLLDKTFITDYFMDRAAGAAGAAGDK